MARRSNLFGVGITTLPSWADYTALPTGNFIEFTTNTPQDALMVRSTLANWCGGSFVPDFGVRGGVAYTGGGEHGVPWPDSYANGAAAQNGAYVLDIDARVYRRRCYPSVNHLGVVDGGIGDATDAWGAYVTDGAPQSKHTYTSLSYMPASWGGGPSGSLMRVSHTGGLVSGVNDVGGRAATWQYDLSKTAHSAADPSIIRLTGSQTYNFGSGLAATLNNASSACIDLVRQGWWSTGTAAANQGGRMVFTSKAGVISAPQGVSIGTGDMTLHHFADDDILIRITDDNVANGYEPIWEVWVWQAGTSSAWVKAPVNRQNITDTYSPGVRAYPAIGYIQPKWSSILGCFVGIDTTYPYAGPQPTTTIRVWKITPPPAGQRFSGTWQITWELVTAKPGTEATNKMNHSQSISADAAVINGPWGRLVECPSLRAFVWTRDVDKKGQLIRLQGM